MRIISKFHDYYDSAAGFGLDPSLVYRRTPVAHVFEARLWKWDRLALPHDRGRYNSRSPLRDVVFGFCGRVYPLWMDSRYPIGVATVVDRATESHVFTIDGAIRVYREYLSGSETGWSRRHGSHTFDEMRAYSKQTWGKGIDEGVFRELQCPAFVCYWSRMSWDVHLSEVTIVTNPRLASFGIQHVFDAFTAFQEIAMFLGQTVTREDVAPRTVGDDEVIAATKGFDEQSFRTMAPGSKKLNRKANRQRKRQQG